MLRLENLWTDWQEFVAIFTGGIVHPEPGVHGAIAHINGGAKRPGSNGNHSGNGFEGFYGAKKSGESDISHPICRYLSNDYSILSAMYKPPLECDEYFKSGIL